MNNHKNIYLFLFFIFFTCSSFSCEKEKAIAPQQEQMQQPKMTIEEAEKLIIGTWAWYQTSGGKATQGRLIIPSTCNCTSKLIFYENKHGEEYGNDTLQNSFTYEIRYGLNDFDNSFNDMLMLKKNNRSLPEFLFLKSDTLMLDLSYMDSGGPSYYLKVKK